MAILADLLRGILTQDDQFAPQNRLAMIAGDAGTAGPIGSAQYQQALAQIMPQQAPQQSAQASFTPSAPQGQGILANAPQAASQPAAQPSGGGFGDFLTGLFDPQRKNRNMTVEWLERRGEDPGYARFLAGNPRLLQDYIVEAHKANRPDYQVQTVYDPQGREQRVLMDMNSGRYQSIGGAKSELLSPAAEAQKVRLAQAGRAETNVNVNGERGYDKTVGEGYGKRFLDIQQGAQTAQRTLDGLQVMENAMVDPNFYSGTGETYINGLKRLAVSIGGDPDKVSSVETFNAMAKQAALDSMGGSLGTGFSNADRDFVTDQVPSLANTPEGNRKLIEIQRKLNVRKQQIAAQARAYAAQHNDRIDAGFDEYLAKWAEQNPLFPKVPSGSGRGAGTDTGRQRARNPSTGEVVEWNGTQWVPAR